MSDSISRAPAVSPTYPLRPVRPVDNKDKRKPRDDRRSPQDDATEHEEVPDAGTDGHSPTIDEYI